MKLEDVKVGMKVKIPTTKMEEDVVMSTVVRRAKNDKQDFLYVARIDDNIIVLNNLFNDDSGDYFYASDLVPYSKACTEKPPIGAKVKIIDDLGQQDYINGVACVSSMLKYAGRNATVTKHNGKGVYLDIDGHGWSWAYDMLEPADLNIVKYKCIKEFPGTKVNDELEFVAALGHDYYLPEYFTPIYENPIPKIEFQGYELKVDGNRVNWGCKSFSKEEIKSVIDFVKVFNKMDLKIGLKHTQDNFDEINVDELEQLYKVL